MGTSIIPYGHYRETFLSDGTVPGKPVRMYEKDGSFSDFSTEEVVVQKLNSFVGWKCAAGVENLCINFDGDVQSASCGSIGQDGQVGKYGNVFETFKLDGEWITCAQQFCSCGADLFIPKSKAKNDVSLLKFRNGEAHELEKKKNSISAPVAVERTFSPKNKQIFWEIGRRCNYDCSYCHPYVHNNFENHKTFEQLKFATEKLEQFSKGEKINFAISGGEPTLNPDFLPWVKYLKKMGHKVSTHSNGSRGPEYYAELIRFSDINISVHFEFYDRKKMTEVLTALAREIYLRKTSLQNVGHVEVMLMMLPGKTEEILSFEKELWQIPLFKDHCTLTIMPIRGHESIDDKSNRKGDVLLPEYDQKDLSISGNRAALDSVEEVSALSHPVLSLYDFLDEIKDPAERQKKFFELAKENS